ncbi:MAG: hypothetical protein JWM96_659, partial [Alphaproteobacteria bacterium]|nr:hypothetical protein [Alphaproteobacteria bacterium]
GEKCRFPALRFFFAQLFFNAIWSPLFFGLHLSGISFVVLLLIIVFTVLTMIQAAKLNPVLCWCLLPYLAWLCYASSLNLYIAVYN